MYRRMNQHPTFAPPSPCGVAPRCWLELVSHSPAYSWDAEAGLSFGLVSRARQEKTVNAGCAIMGGQHVRPSATHWGNSLLGSLSTGSLVGHLQNGGLMYSQASVMPGNTGDSTACVIGRSEK
jgi:hypothetical protein